MTQIVKVRNMMRLVAATSAALFAMSAGSAFASSFNGTNEDTGPSSENHNKFDASSKVDFDWKNEANLKNLVDADINTGKNKVSKNTNAEGGDTGSIDAQVAFENNANNDPGYIDLAGATPDVNADFSNSDTGPWSSNDNKLDVKNTVKVKVRNDADISNKADINANTGKNNTYGNTNADGGTTGNISVGIDAVNNANNGSGANIGGLGGGGDVNASANNSDTGPNSENKNTVKVKNSVDVNVRNEADITNKFNVDANTGKNTTSHNTNAGNNGTGDAAINIQVQNTANSN
jgi:hypothetical protein